MEPSASYPNNGSTKPKTSGSRRHFTITLEIGTPVIFNTDLFHEIVNKVGNGVSRKFVEALGLEVVAYTVRDNGVVDP